MTDSPDGPASTPQSVHSATRALDRAATALIALMLAASAVVYRALPPVLATHWGADGTGNGWTPRLPAVLLLPGLAIVLWLVLRAAPAIDPRKARYAQFAGTYRTVAILPLALLAGVHGIILAAGLGYHLPVARLAVLGVGALLLVLGNVLPRVRPNYFVGIRTPWTLASDAVWARTHRVGGYLLAGAGVVTLAAGLLGGPYVLPAAVASATAAALATVCYSYAAWRREAAHAVTRPRPRP